MKSNKILRIGEGYFNLPDDFEGSLGDALMLLAEYTLEREATKNTIKETRDSVPDIFLRLWNDDSSKCSIGFDMYKLLQNGKEWEKF